MSNRPYLPASLSLNKEVGESGNDVIFYENIYGLEHLAIRILKKFKKRVYEKDVVYLIFCFQIIICLLSLWLFKSALF